MQKITVTPTINPESEARLPARSYDKDWTDVPNRALPADVFKALSAIYSQLSGGQELDSEGYTFSVRADNGIFKSIVAPSVFRDADVPEEGDEITPKDNLVIRWGGHFFPLTLTSEGVSFADADPKAKMKLRFATEKVGKWDETVLNVSLTNSKDKEIYTMSFPVRSADWENKLDPDVADVLMEEGSIAELLDYFQLKPSGNGTGGGGKNRLKGHFVKAGHFPIGNYTATSYRTKVTPYKTEYLIQVQVPEPFVAPINLKDEESGQWVEREVEVSDWAIMKSNTALGRVFAAEPIVNEENPAKIEIYEHGDYNGKPVAKLRVEVSSFEEKDGEIALNF